MALKTGPAPAVQTAPGLHGVHGEHAPTKENAASAEARHNPAEIVALKIAHVEEIALGMPGVGASARACVLPDHPMLKARFVASAEPKTGPGTVPALVPGIHGANGESAVMKGSVLRVRLKMKPRYVAIAVREHETEHATAVVVGRRGAHGAPAPTRAPALQEK